MPKLPASVSALSQRLAHLARLLSKDQEVDGEVDEFYRLIDQLLELPEEDEHLATQTAMSILLDSGDMESSAYLVGELEMEATLYYSKEKGSPEKASLAFAVPVVVPSGDPVRKICEDGHLAQELVRVLDEASIIDDTARFGIIPRLFSYKELMAKSYGQLRALMRELSEHVKEGDELLRMPPDFEHHVVEGGSASPFVDLYFLLGVVVTRSSELNNIFPDLPEELDEEMEGPGGSSLVMADSMSIPGRMPDGEPWEQDFCEAFNDAFGAMYGAVAVTPPDGLIEDLRRGLEMSRTIGTLRMFEVNGYHLPTAPGQTPGAQSRPLWVRLGALQEYAGVRGVWVEAVEEPGGLAVDGALWEVLPHENDNDAVEKLWEELADVGLEPEFPIAMAHTALSSVTLN